MFETTSYTTIENYRQYAAWLLTLLLIAVGFKYAKDIITLVLDKLYQFFIQNHALNVK